MFAVCRTPLLAYIWSEVKKRYGQLLNSTKLAQNYDELQKDKNIFSKSRGEREPEPAVH